MKRVLVFGTFDILHPGHASFLRQARRRGSILLAAVARDGFVASFKGRPPRHTEVERKRALRATGLVDAVYLGDRSPGSYAVVKRLRPDVICLGHDQHLLEADLREWIRRSGIKLEVHRLRGYRPDIYKSSKIEKAASQAGHAKRGVSRRV
jgi:FAD synthetase